MAQTSLNSTGVASSGALSLQSNGTTEAIGISTGQVATLAQNPILTSGTVNGLAFLNASKVLTTGSALTFDGTNFGVGSASGNFRIESPSTYLGTGRIGQVSMGLAGSGYPQVGYNFRTTSTTNVFNYDVSDVSSVIQFNNGQFIFKSATSGTAGAAISYSEQMRLTSTGLGIGTSSPSAKVTVAASNAVVASRGTAYLYATDSMAANFGGQLSFGGSYTGTTETIFASVAGRKETGTAGDIAGYLQFSTTNPSLGNVERMRIDSAGNLGLGVTPSAWGIGKTMQLGSQSALTSYSTNTYLSTNWYNASGDKYIGSGNAMQYVQTGGQHQWLIAPSGTAGNAITFTQALTLDASGKLFLNKTTGSGRFNVQQTGSEDVVSITLGSGGSAFTVSSSGVSNTLTAAYYITSSGFAGQITCSGTTTIYSATSDYRLKTVIGNVSDSGERIDALQPIDYEWKSDGKRTRGFLAHKFQEVYPNSVIGEKDAVDSEGKPVYQTMQAGTSEVIADLVAEIQSLRKRLAALEAK